MKIYISSSWKNREEVRKLAVTLRRHGCEVFDFTDPACRKTHEAPPEMFPEQFDPSKHRYKEYIDRPEWRDAVAENREAIANSDLILLLLPCGIDATADWAYGVGLGKPSIIVGQPRAGERSAVHLWAEAILESADEAVSYILSKNQEHLKTMKNN
ncbi:MAG: hypothetical protein QHH06_14590 [Clostridiales bacterium]|jgi:hypothetical protein|nr:hypothetical protein [Eubacteriales bacterium]MDH7567669.1 hypothetical protein [Clostridiales bacterium]